MVELILLALAGLIGMCVLMWRWHWGVYALMAFLPFEAVFIIGGFRSGLKVLTAATLLAMLFSAYRSREVRDRLVGVLGNRTFLLALFFTVWAIMSTLWAVSPGAALSKSFSFIGVTVLVLLIGMLRSRELFRSWGLLIAGGTASVVIGLLQGGFSAANARFIGAGDDPNEYAGLLLILSAILVYGMDRFRWWYAPPLIIMMAGALLTQSRTGMVTLLVVPLIAAVALSLRNGAPVLRGTIVAYAVGAVIALSVFRYFPQLSQDLFARAETLNNYSDPDTWAGRLDIWAGGVQMWAQSPLLGVGAGNFGLLSPDYSTTAALLAAVKGVAVAHNTYLSNLAELGVFGFALFLGLLWMVYSRSVQLSQVQPMARAMVVGIIAVMIIATTLSLEYSKILFVLVGTQVAVMFNQRSQPRP